MSGVIRWEDPPPIEMGTRGGGRTPWALIAEQLRARPGCWAVVYEGRQDPTVAHRIRAGKYTWLNPPGAFEATQRLLDDGTFAVYARYVGEPS